MRMIPKASEDTDKLYCKLFLKQCHQLHDILPGLFEADSDYMELLFGISYTNKDDVIYMLVNPETGIPEADFNVSTLDEEGNPTGQVEIIGWLYQYYNTELKDDTFAKLKKNVKITKERIPAATQLFTPDWIVRYMVENSVGRIWIEYLRAVDPSTDEKTTAERFGWKYYLPEAEQEEDVNVKLAEIRTTYKDLKPTDITCIDPCMGSGHILIAMFDVLMDIYESAGYDKREAAFEIVEHNIHGLDVDQRAYQLAYFAVMMKGRGYNRRFLRGRNGKPEPKVYAIVESNEINRNHLQFFGTHLSGMERNLSIIQIEGLLDTFKDAREYGSILNVDACDWNVLNKFVNDLGTTGQISFENMGSEETQKQLKKLVKVAKILGQHYYAVVTNPPYMGFSYTDNDSFEEHYVSVPEQGGGKLIPEGMGKPGSVYTVSKSKTGMIGCYMLETQMMPGNGKLTCTGIGSGKEPKEATNTAFNYLKANGNRISGQISTTTKDYIINYQDMQGIGMTGNLALPTLIAICSAALGKTPLNSLAILGEISIGGTLIKVDELASTLQVCLDSGAKKVLLPITSAGDLGTVPSDLVGAFSLIFYSSAEEAVFKALGVE